MPLTDGPILEYGDVEGPVQTQEGEKRCCSPSHPNPPGGAALALGQGGSRATVPSPHGAERSPQIRTLGLRTPRSLSPSPHYFPSCSRLSLLPPPHLSSSPPSRRQWSGRAGRPSTHSHCCHRGRFCSARGPPSKEVPPRTAGPRGLPGLWEDLLAPLSSHLWHPRGPRCPPPSPPSRACSQ